jgi:hypothetical protein
MGAAVKRVPVSIWGGLVVALLGWQIGMRPPGVGLDPSWNAGLAMGVDQGLHWGTEVVFTYGPLGFLQTQLVWFSGQAVLAFLYSSVVFVVFSIGLVWALRRRLPLVLACVAAFVVVAILPLLEMSLLSAVFAAFWLLEPGRERTPRQLDAFVVVAATFAAPAALIKLSTGPLVAVVLLIALIGARVGTRRVVAYVAILAAELLLLWLATGQRLADIPDFVSHTIQISSGYSSAMLRSTDVAPWKVTAASVGAMVLSLALAVAAWKAPWRDRRGRWAGTLLVALTAFAIYKEGIVRVDAGHLTVLFANACVLWIAVGFGVGRRVWVPAIAVLVFALSLPLRPTGTADNIDFVSNVRFAVEQAHTLVSPGRRHTVMEEGRQGLKATYALTPQQLEPLEGHTVAIEPWEIGAAWAYGLDWKPQPIFQNYSAYTPTLDRLNAAAIEDPHGPERILRESQLAVNEEFPTPDLDNRFAGWDPPEQARAVLCNFIQITADDRWQVLGRVPDRCGPERELESVSAAAGEAVDVPKPGPGEVVLARVHGAGLSGLEHLQAFLFHAPSRHATIDGQFRLRLVPETAGDGLMLQAGIGVLPPEAFPLVPQATSIAIEGGADRITYDFYAFKVR